MQQGRAHLFIRGRVQGVFYRAYTRETAATLGLSGWVRNLPDGSVEVLFEGKKEDIDQAIRRCHAGPPGALVDDIAVSWEDFQGNLKGFQIRYY